jgi:hypothetical protein
MNPDAYAQPYAKGHGISVEEAKKILEENNGTLQKQGGNQRLSMTGSVYYNLCSFNI